jgi:drug/metabolite transporter (DMT)-like permease
MQSPAGLAIAAMTLMLWILWSDSVRPRKPSPTLYLMRIVLYLILGGVLVFKMIQGLPAYSTTARVLSLAAAMTSIGGAVYFGKKLSRKKSVPVAAIPGVILSREDGEGPRT